MSFRETLDGLSIDERIPLLEESLRQHVAGVLRMDPDNIDGNMLLEDLSPLLKESHIRNRMLIRSWVNDELGFRKFYDYEAGLCRTITQYSRYLAHEIEPIAVPRHAFDDPLKGGEWGWSEPSSYTGKLRAEGKTLFVLGSGRSGTTLFQAMLGGHPQIYAPGELHLLPFNDMKQRRLEIGRLEQQWMNNGLIDVLSDHMGMSEAEAIIAMNVLSDESMPVIEVYRQIQSMLNNRWLSDKSPTYAMHPQWLQRAEQMFDQPSYIFMRRHPYSVMESFVRSRFHRYSAAIWNFGDDNPWHAAEKYWGISNYNIINFLKQVPTSRKYCFSYETLMQQTAESLEAVCKFLSLPYQEAMLDPYQPGRNLNQHLSERTQIDTQLAESWREKKPPHQLSSFTLRVAEELGYECD